MHAGIFFRPVLALLTAIGCAHQGAAPASSLPGGRLFVTNEYSNDVSVIDVESGLVVATLPVGKRPRGLRLSADGRLLYVAVSGSAPAPPRSAGVVATPDRDSDGIAVLDLTTGSLRRMVRCGQDPETFDLVAGGRLAVVSNEDAAEASVVEMATGAILGTLAVGAEPEGVRTRPGSTQVAITSEGAGTVTLIDALTRAPVGTFLAGERPRGIAFTSTGGVLLVTGENSGTVTAVDAATLQRRYTVHLEDPNAKPMGIVLSPDDRTAYVTTGRGGGVVLIDVASGSVIGHVARVGARPWGIAVSRDGRRLFTANGPSNDVSVIDVESRQVVQRIAVGRQPWGVALSD
jgi:YVTN family beta-propeller protein